MGGTPEHNPEMKLDAAAFGPAPAKKSIRDGFGKALVEIGGQDELVWALSADVSESSRTHRFAEKLPERFVQCGVAEQNMAGVAAGLASCGKKPFISAFAAFSPGRNFDQIRVSVCYNGSDVKIHASHAGLAVGPDGASHQILEDIGMMRMLPNMRVVVPCDIEEARKATFALAASPGPAYLRTSRENCPVMTTKDTPFALGKANVFRDGGDLAIFACGAQVFEAMKAAEALEGKGISAAVINMHTIKPLDEGTVLAYAKKCRLLVSVEDHQIAGGLGSAIAEMLCDSHPARLLRLGMRDAFGESGNAAELYAKFGFDAAGIAKAAEGSL
jgi:transketolase